MQVEILTLCDAAADYQGRLSLLGAFDTIMSASFPATHPQCNIALRVRFHRIEEGSHSIRIHVVDDDGALIMPNLEGQVGVTFVDNSETASVNFILGIQGLPLAKPGTYAVNLAVDGKQEASVPLYIKEAAHDGAA
ncbi:MAG TPA: hypothetical protein VH113_10840 [Gemmatimonadales bacterium]|jgi:hypothetical protein|nr:hypothetical protein [Gemmatimonadales bacterium]